MQAYPRPQKLPNSHLGPPHTSANPGGTVSSLHTASLLSTRAPSQAPSTRTTTGCLSNPRPASHPTRMLSGHPTSPILPPRAPSCQLKAPIYSPRGHISPHKGLLQQPQPSQTLRMLSGMRTARPSLVRSHQSQSWMGSLLHILPTAPMHPPPQTTAFRQARSAVWWHVCEGCWQMQRHLCAVE